MCDGPKSDNSFNLLKLEYEKAAERYENVYKAMWQNFSYLSLMSAAILTFGTNQLETWATLFIAGCPLLFWFGVQFIPLDAYGRDVRLRLRDIEQILNKEYFGALPPEQTGSVQTSRGLERVAEIIREKIRALIRFIGQAFNGELFDRLVGNIPPSAGLTPVRMAHFTEFAGKPRSNCWPRYTTRVGILVSALAAFLIWTYAIVSLLSERKFDWIHFVKKSVPEEVHMTGSLSHPAQELGTPNATPEASLTPNPTPQTSLTPNTTPQAPLTRRQ